MLRSFNNTKFFILGFLFWVFLFVSSMVFAGNPVAPIHPSDNIQDPGALSTPWGGCGPTDSNCYVTADESQWTTTGSDIYYSTGNVGIGTSVPGAPLDITSNVDGNGVNVNLTTPVSGSYAHALNITLASDPGYVDSSQVATIYTTFSAVGTNDTIGTQDYVSSNIYADTQCASGHVCAGVWASANTSGVNSFLVGVAGDVLGDASLGNKTIGVFGNASTVGTTHTGGYFSLGVAGYTATPANSALIADNASSTDPIFLGRDNGSTVFTILDGGNVGVGDASPSALLTVGSGDKFQVDNNGAITSASIAGSGVKCLHTDNNGVISVAAADCGSGSGGDSISVNSGAASDANFLDVAATGSITGTTWTLVGASTPDDITLAISNASATTAGAVTTGSQTFAGSKTFSSAPTFSSMTAGSIYFAGTSGILQQDNSNFFWDDTNNFLGLGANSSLKSRLHIAGSTTASGADAIAGTFSDLTLSNSTSSGSQFGNRTLVTVSGSVAGNEIGNFLRVTDSTSLANTVRGLEIQAYSGTNTAGTNTGIATFGKTFGLHAVTTGEAGGVSVPAAVFADLDNGNAPTSGNAFRAYTDNATSATLLSLYQETSAFSGDGLVMNFGNNSGSFSGNFLNLQKAGSAKFTISNTGRIDISASDSDNIIPLYINSEESTATQTLFAIESDSTGNSQSADTVKAHFEADGKLYISLTGTQNTVALCHSTNGLSNNDQIVDCSGAPSDIAEWYEAESDVSAGDIVAVSDSRIEFDYASGIGTVIDENGNKTEEVPLPGSVRSMAVLSKAGAGQTVIGVVSTAPYQTFGEDVLKTAVHPERIALAGRVPVKVTNENGQVKAGDRLTLSAVERGYAMRQTTPGESIGVALEDAEGDTDNVLVFINTGYQYVYVDSNSAGEEVLFSRGIDLAGSSILNVKSISSVLGNWSIDEDGNIVANSIEVEDGMSMKDPVTGLYYCVRIVNGDFAREVGKCKDAPFVPPSGVVEPVSGDAPSNENVDGSPEESVPEENVDTPVEDIVPTEVVGDEGGSVVQEAGPPLGSE